MIRLWTLLALLLPSVACGETVIGLKAVKKNNVPISPPTSSIAAAPGDTIEAEIYFSGWGLPVSNPPLPGGRLTGYQATLAGRAGATSGTRGMILPLGWDAPLDRVNCQTATDCPAEFPVCDPYWSGCVGADHNPFLGAYVDPTRPDAFPSFCDIISNPGVDVWTLDYKYHVNSFTNCGAGDLEGGDGSIVCGGTLILKASEDACGTFTFGFKPSATFLEGSEGPSPVLPSLIPLVISISCPCELQGSEIPNCAIDARIPHDPGDARRRFGWDTMTLTFLCDTTGLTAEDFEVTAEPFPAIPPKIVSVAGHGHILTVTFSEPIPIGRWTCLTHLESGERLCIGSLPGDVKGVGVTCLCDIPALVNSLNGLYEPPGPLYKCDIDRNGLCAPPDILALIDLLVGAGAFEVYNGATLPPCPSLPPP